MFKKRGFIVLIALFFLLVYTNSVVAQCDDGEYHWWLATWNILTPGGVGEDTSDDACCPSIVYGVVNHECYNALATRTVYSGLGFPNGKNSNAVLLLEGCCGHGGYWYNCDDHAGDCKTCSGIDHFGHGLAGTYLNCNSGSCWVESGESSAHGEYSAGATSCCGDDSGEYFISYNGRTACCDNPNDQLDSNGNCVGCECSVEGQCIPDYSGMVCDGCHWVATTAKEICDGVDNNCNGQVDEGVPNCGEDFDGHHCIWNIYQFYLDNDLDYYTPDRSDIILVCMEEHGWPNYVNYNGRNYQIYYDIYNLYNGDLDCNDYDERISPGYGEICDDKDNNCNGLIDENLEGSSCGNCQDDSDNNGNGLIDQDDSGCTSYCGYPNYFLYNNNLWEDLSKQDEYCCGDDKDKYETPRACLNGFNNDGSVNCVGDIMCCDYVSNANYNNRCYGPSSLTPARTIHSGLFTSGHDNVAVLRYGNDNGGWWFDCDSNENGYDCAACDNNYDYWKQGVSGGVNLLNCDGLECWIVSGENNPYGEYTTKGQINCCGDDSGEYFIKTTIIQKDSTPLTPGIVAGTYSACCDNSNDCVDSTRACQIKQENTKALCSDGADNDCDGYVDCQDSNCKVEFFRTDSYCQIAYCDKSKSIGQVNPWQIVNRNKGDKCADNLISNAIDYGATFRCSSGIGDDKYAKGGDYRCQGYCDGNGKCDYSYNCEKCEVLGEDKWLGDAYCQGNKVVRKYLSFGCSPDPIINPNTAASCGGGTEQIKTVDTCELNEYCRAQEGGAECKSLVYKWILSSFKVWIK